MINPGLDEFVTERYAFEIQSLLDHWSRDLKAASALELLAEFTHPSLRAGALTGATDTKKHSSLGIEILHRSFANSEAIGRDRFIDEMGEYLAGLKKIETAQFEITAIQRISDTVLAADIRYELVGSHDGSHREQRIGTWRTEWQLDQGHVRRVQQWHATGEAVSRSRGPIFTEITAAGFGRSPSFREQLSFGVDHWRTVLDGATGIDVYGNCGISCGDYDNNGFDDLYVCQPAGLPNRLYRNRGDGTFEDVTDKAGVGVLDNTSCALFADFDNKGFQDLLVVTTAGPLLFVNQGDGRFVLKKNAFQFVRPPQGSFTHAAVADYDRDGQLDIYFCVYNYYAGLDQYRYPVPYFDARNGPPNFLFHNDGNFSFTDTTEAAGLNLENDRYSFACAWGDLNGNGWPDLCVANDFGRGNLYRNNGNGTFSAASAESGVDGPGAGMSACWADFNADGHQDIYVANMWSAAGMRVTDQSIFHQADDEKIRTFYRRHARGNSLYQEQGDGKFDNVAEKAGAEIGRWAWSSDAWDFDHDGFPDLYITNGYITGPTQPDLASFFWRQLVAVSPTTFSSSPRYESAWNAINELIRSDATWNGNERNILYLNNGDGTFSDVSGVAGLDFVDDSRAFALSDLDHDGRLEVVLKNRTAPQLRLLKNVMTEIGNSICFRLRGTRSNRDAIGTAITIESGGRKQTKYLQAGSGFLSQHTKEIFFGLGKSQSGVRAIVRWPSGAEQIFNDLPVNSRVEIQEERDHADSKPFAAAPSAYSNSGTWSQPANLGETAETWLVQPLAAPDFSLPDVNGKPWKLSSLRGSCVVVNFWSAASSKSLQQLKKINDNLFVSSGVRVLSLNVDDPRNEPATKSLVAKEAPSVIALLADATTSGVYNVIFRYLFDRHADLPIPASFLIGPDGMIVKVYQGSVDPRIFAEDARSIPSSSQERMWKALPFHGQLHLADFQRNNFTYGVALFQRGYLDQAAESFKQAIAVKPEDPEAYYNLGTLYLRKRDLDQARVYLDKTLRLKPNYPEAWNNLGMVAAEEGRGDEAESNFMQSLSLRPDYAVALVNLGNIYRRQRRFDESEALLTHALRLQPEDPEVNYSAGMLYAQKGDPARAERSLERAITLRPGYADALNNLGVLLVRQQRLSEAKDKFETCVHANPDFDQAYLNLARVYVILNEKDKARETLQALLRQQPQHKMAQQALEMLQ